MTSNDMWQAVLGEIELQISRPNFLTWLKGSRLVEKNEKEGIALVSLPNNFAREWVKNRYHKLILGSLRNLDSSIRSVNYIVSAANIPVASFKKGGNRINEPEKSQSSLIEFRVDQKTNLNPRYTFKNFIVGSSNELAYAAVQAVLNDVGKKYNPLFVYGGVGLGKTHLLQAGGNAIQEQYKNKVNVLYVTSEKFINDVVQALRNKRIEDVKKKYRDIDVLIVDDIQFIGGKTATELEFFYTFNALYENSKQIIISSDRPPAAIPTLHERLKSRFEGGMVADISYPDYEMRLAILKTKVQNQNVTIDEKILETVATKVQKNIRELGGVLNKIIFYEQYKKEKIDNKQLEEIINETIQVAAKNITPNEIIKAVADFYEIPQNEIAERSRRQEVVEPRQITMYLLREMLKLSYPHIGEKLGHRDHTTVIHAYEKISKEANQNPGLNQKIILIKERLYKS